MIDRKPHVHAALIKAWADGTEIEYRWLGAPNAAFHSWRDLNGYTCYPTWNVNFEYRVKPEPHKWQKEIDAFAAGKTIQCGYPTTHPQHGWYDLTGVVPSWDKHHPDCVFRVKPEKVVWRGRAKNYMGPQVGLCITLFLAPPKEQNLQLTFEDGKLIAAQVL